MSQLRPLSYLRLTRNLNQTELGKKICISAMPISKFELTKNHSYKYLLRYLEALDYKLVLKAKFKYREPVELYIPYLANGELQLPNQLRLVDLRNEQGLTQVVVGERMNWLQGPVSRIEIGKCSAELRSLKNYLKALNADLIVIAKSKDKEIVLDL